MTGSDEIEIKKNCSLTIINLFGGKSILHLSSSIIYLLSPPTTDGERASDNSLRGDSILSGCILLWSHLTYHFRAAGVVSLTADPLSKVAERGSGNDHLWS